MRTPMGEEYFARTCVHIELDKEDTFPDSRCLILVRSDYVSPVLTGMVITCDFPCTCILVLVKNRLYVLFVPNGAQWYMDPWSFGFMAKWIHGSLDSWHNGCMAVWIHGTMDE